MRKRCGEARPEVAGRGAEFEAGRPSTAAGGAAQSNDGDALPEHVPAYAQAQAVHPSQGPLASSAPFHTRLPRRRPSRNPLLPQAPHRIRRLSRLLPSYRPRHKAQRQEGTSVLASQWQASPVPSRSATHLP